jgi:hypothetical protein
LDAVAVSPRLSMIVVTDATVSYDSEVAAPVGAGSWSGWVGENCDQLGNPER